MINPAPATQPQAADPAHPRESGDDPIAQERIGRHAAWLAEFGELVLRASRAIVGKIEAAAERPLHPAQQAEPSPHLKSLSKALEGLGRALRLTCALETRLDEERKGELKLAAERRARVAQDHAREARRPADEASERAEAVREAVESLIDTRPEREREELFDRADEALLILDGLAPEAVLKRPVSAWIAETCERLDLKPDWELWEDEPWAEEEAQDRAPSSPYAFRRGAVIVRPPRPLADPADRSAVKGPP